MEVREPSARYLVKPGIKQTEVGTTPSDWKAKQLRDFQPFVTSGSRGWAAYYSEIGAPFIRITNLSRESIYPDLADTRYVSVPPNDVEGIRTRLRTGDVLISITADIGIVGYVSDEIPTPAYINQHIALVRFNPLEVCPKYISYFLASGDSQKAFQALTDSGAKSGMNLTTVSNIWAALPPTVEEQQAIANALGDADALIESLQHLLAKKRQIKQGTMQALLTGQQRLPGFEGAWLDQPLQQICRMRSGTAITSESIDDSSEHRCYGGNGIRGFTRAFTHDGDFVLIGRQGALCGNVTTVSGRFFASEHAIVVTPNRDLDFRWLALVLERMNLNQFSESSAQPGLSVEKLLLLECRVPESGEQTAIATVLADLDAEITALDTKLTKARALKQGMMQTLLTGRIRLV